MKKIAFATIDAFVLANALLLLVTPQAWPFRATAVLTLAMYAFGGWARARLVLARRRGRRLDAELAAARARRAKEMEEILAEGALLQANQVVHQALVEAIGDEPRDRQVEIFLSLSPEEVAGLHPSDRRFYYRAARGEM